MEDKFIEEKPLQHVPHMKVLLDLASVKPKADTTVVVKADGEFTYAYFNRQGISYTVNKWGHYRRHYPALDQLTDALTQTDVQTCELLGELYGIDEQGRPEKLPQFIHLVKSGLTTLLSRVVFGAFNIVSVNGEPCKEPMLWRLQRLHGWLHGYKNVHCLSYVAPKTRQDIEDFWKHHVEDCGHDGLVVYQDDETYKLKPIHELDAVIIGINKKTSGGRGNLFAQNMVTSVHLALMTENGGFVEVGDCASGIDHQLRSALWKLMDYKIGEDEQMVYVKPLVVATIQYTDLYKGHNKTYRYDGKTLAPTGTTPLIRFRHPRLKCFRPDKQVNPLDLRTTQIPEPYLQSDET